MMEMELKILIDTYAICKFKPDSDMPEALINYDFFSVTKAQDELSIVCKQSEIIAGEFEINKDWRILKIIGPLDFSLVGIIAEISGLLSKSKISIFTISTYDTDYILVKNKNLEKAVEVLESNGKKIIFEK
jgi:uncharacterized protein